MSRSRIWIVLGSISDLPNFEEGEGLLKQFKIPYEVKILSAHRTPALLKRHLDNLPESVQVIIAGAGGAAHLAGVIASHTLLPVLGVPMPSKLGGVDSFVSTSQMPAGIPVATMSIGKAGATNAVLLAAQILSLREEPIAKRLGIYRASLVRGVEDANRTLRRRRRA